MDIDEIRRWHQVFKRDDELFEIRLLGERVWSGYFYNVEDAIEKLQPFDSLNIYFSVNEVKSACASRSQYGCFQQVKGTATSKLDIEHRWYIPIDVDCERPSGVCSTDAEKALAHAKAGAVYRFLKTNGFPEPIVCDSSSGYHIYVPIDMDNTPEVEVSIKSFLEILGSHFTDDHVKIDNVLFDANRIIRLPGTFGRKGRNTVDRPHRQARILSIPSEIVRANKDFIDAFNSKYKVVAEQPSKNFGNYGHDGRYGESFDLRKFIRDNGISIDKEIAITGGGTKFILTECVFDSGHKSPDAAIFEMPNGAIAYKCFHQSCSCYEWKDVRLKFDPHAYERPFQPQPQYRPLSFAGKPHAQPSQTPAIKEETEELGKKWLSLKDIQKVNILDIPHVLTGFTELDKAIKGLFLGEVTILSGSNSSGKSSWLNSLLLNIVQQGEKVALWSGELRSDVLKTWIQMVASGVDGLRQTSNGAYWYVPEMTARAIDDWLDGNFVLYNNEYSSSWTQLFHDMQELLALGFRFFILDNLMSLDIDIIDGDGNKKQKALITQICQFSKKNKIHLILVAHPRKVSTFIRKTDISGTSDLTNAVDNVFIVHRVNNDFKKLGGDFLGEAYIKRFFDYGNVVEVAKNRLMGIQDLLVGMYYEMESRRFKNTVDEKRIYGWRSDLGEQKSFFVQKDPTMPFEPSEGEAPF